MMRRPRVLALSNAPLPLPTAQRVWVALTQVALLLPFVTAHGCDNGKITDYTGIDLYLFESQGGGLLALLVVMAPLLAFPYAGQPIGRALASLGLRAWLAGAGLLLAVAAPQFVLLFRDLTYNLGWYLHVGGWAALYGAFVVGCGVVLARGGGARPRGRIAIVVAALLVATPVAIALNLLHNELTATDIGIELVIGYGMCLPLALAGMGLAREAGDGPVRRSTSVTWWGLVLLTLGTHVAGALSD